jgi:hypothetical protein
VQSGFADFLGAPRQNPNGGQKAFLIRHVCRDAFFRPIQSDNAVEARGFARRVCPEITNLPRPVAGKANSFSQAVAFLCRHIVLAAQCAAMSDA